MKGIYLHIPFCLSKCPYCGFYSIVQPGSVEAFVQALLEEIRFIATNNPPLPPGERDRVRADSWTFDTVYFGGGTPSVLHPKQIEIIIKQINRYFILTDGIESTFEANPGDCDYNYFQEIFGLGINRLNLGVQSFDEKTLRFLGRRHTAVQARKAIEDARQAGFKNIGLDLMYCLPGQGIDCWLDMLAVAIKYSPEHLSCYQLAIEDKTPFAIELQKGTFFLPDEEVQHDFFIRTAEFLEANGYIHYEVSNFSRGEEYFSRHNQKYWDHTPYLGIGPSAHSFDGSKRWWNCRSVTDYISILSQGKLPIQGQEILTTAQLSLERFFLGLRTKKGIHLQTFMERYSQDLIQEKGKELLRLQEEGLIYAQDGYIRPTLAGLAVADRLALM